MSTRVPPGPGPGSAARPDDPDAEGVRPVEESGDAGSDAASDGGQMWTAMWRDALNAALRTLPADDDEPVPGDT